MGNTHPATVTRQSPFPLPFAGVEALGVRSDWVMLSEILSRCAEAGIELGH